MEAQVALLKRRELFIVGHCLELLTRIERVPFGGANDTVATTTRVAIRSSE